jgi:cyanophycinase
VRDSQKSARKIGALVLIGGAEDKTGEARVLREFVGLTGGHKSRLVVFTVASEEPVESGRSYMTAFRRLGVKDVQQLDIPDRTHATAPAAAACLEAATRVFFTGRRGRTSIPDTPTHAGGRAFRLPPPRSSR